MPKGDTGRLHALSVVVTRPVDQANELCAALESAGATVIKFPTIEIKLLPPTAGGPPLAERLAAFDWAIFISANAVQAALRQLNPTDSLPATLKLAAVGASTAKALHKAGYVTVITPTDTYDSEALLALPELQQVKDKSIAILRGVGGRELLAATLQERGAEVAYFELYQRLRPVLSPAPLIAAWQVNQLDAIVATSAAGLQNLYELVAPEAREQLLATPLAVVTPRMVQLAQQLGFQQPCILAERADTSAIVAALDSWHWNTGASHST